MVYKSSSSGIGNFFDKPGREPYGDEPSPINLFERKVRSSFPYYYYYFIYVTNRVVGLVGRTVNLLLLWKIRWKTQNNPWDATKLRNKRSFGILDEPGLVPAGPCGPYGEPSPITMC